VSSLAKFFTLPLREQRDVAEATLSLAVARLLLHVPFRWLAPLCGQLHPSADGALPVLSEDENSSALAVRRAMLRAAGRLPWDSSCLVRALAAQMMLRRRHLPSVLQLGVRAGAATDLSAHAWLKCGDVNVIGDESAAEFTPIAAFHA
jgi:Transglutaminase-like superfamily